MTEFERELWEELQLELEMSSYDYWRMWLLAQQFDEPLSLKSTRGALVQGADDPRNEEKGSRQGDPVDKSE